MDGRAAVRHAVDIRIEPSGLVILGADGAPLARWPIADLRPAGEWFRNGPFRLASASAPGARLESDDPAFRDALRARGPRLRRGGALGARPGRLIAGIGLAIAVGVAVVVYGIPLLASPIAALVPPEWERALGEQVADEMLRGKAACEAAPGRAALDRLTARLAAVAETPFDITVRVADVDAVNAFAAPGGEIVVFRGLLDFAKSGDEVAGVLAHEIGHVVERHAIKAVVRAAGVSLVSQVLVGDSSGLLALLGGAGEMFLALSYSREAEAEADARALALLRAARIDATALAAFFKRLADRPNRLPEGLAFLSTHPTNDARAAFAAANGAPGAPALSARDWRALKSICGQGFDGRFRPDLANARIMPGPGRGHAPTVPIPRTSAFSPESLIFVERPFSL